MTLRTRILLVYLLIVGGGGYYLVYRSLEELRPRYLESMEESLVDTANLLAAVIEGAAVREGKIDAGQVRAAVDAAFQRTFSARVYSMDKQRVDLRLYVTDGGGRVLYDSDGGKAEGQDYSRWLDVSKTLRGEYGARATRIIPTDDDALVLYIAAPIKARESGKIIGVLSVGKPTASINELVRAARRRVAIAGALGGGLLVVLGVAFSIWIATPIARLTDYARAVRDGRKATLPRLAGREVGELRQAFEEMRAALDGKAYVERYVQTLTHEIKSPLSAIRGAAELLAEEPPADVRARFVGNIRGETARIQRIVDQLLQLAALEVGKARAEFATVDLVAVAREIVDAAQSAAQMRGVSLELTVGADENGVGAVNVRGDRGLLGQAVSNLLQNALAFTPKGGRVNVNVAAANGGGRGAEALVSAVVCIEDTGTGIPEYALPRIFERFYSLARPGSGEKSTGLGLSLVREIAHLHDGEVTVANRADGVVGVRAELKVPVGADLRLGETRRR